MFDYLGVLISLILGLALTHLLYGLTRLIELRDSARIYWVQIVWTANIVLFVLAIWWGMFWWKHLAAWTFQQFLFLAGYSIVLFMLASLLYPHECGHETDFEAHFFKQRRWFFGLLIVVFLFDIPETLFKATDHLRGVPPQYIVFVPYMVAISIAGLVTANRRVHAVLSLLWLFGISAYLLFSSLDRIAVPG